MGFVGRKRERMINMGFILLKNPTALAVGLSNHN